MIQQTVSPVDGKIYTERAYADAARIDDVMDRAVAAQRDWARRSIAERAVFCTRC